MRPLLLFLCYYFSLLHTFSTADSENGIEVIAYDRNASAFNTLTFSYSVQLVSLPKTVFVIGLSSFFTYNPMYLSLLQFSLQINGALIQMPLYPEYHLFSPGNLSSCGSEILALHQLANLNDFALSHFFIFRSNSSQIYDPFQLQFTIPNLQNPSKSVVLPRPSGFLATFLTENQDSVCFDPAQFIRAVPFESLRIVPNNISDLSFYMHSRIVGQRTNASLALTLCHALKQNDSLMLTFPEIFDLGVSLSVLRMGGLPLTDWEAHGNTLVIQFPQLIPKDKKIEIQFLDLILPAQEGSIGRSLRIDCVDPDKYLTSQGYVDLTSISLTKIILQFNRTALTVQEGEPAAAFAFQASPFFKLKDQESIIVRFNAQLGESCLYNVSIFPLQLQFTTWNLSQSAQVQVAVQDDNIVNCAPANGYKPNLLSVQVVLVSSNSSVLYEYRDHLPLLLVDNNSPVIRLSSSFLGTLMPEKINSLSYDVKLEFQPQKPLNVHMQSTERDDFFELDPSVLTFETEKWDIPQKVIVRALNTNNSLTQQKIVTLRHTVSEFDEAEPFFIPQRDVTFYYQKSEAYSCPAPCESGYLATTRNASSSEHICVKCPLGFYCKGKCHDPIPCPKGTASYTSLASSDSVCKPCLQGWYASQEGSIVCMPCPAGAACSNVTVPFVPCGLGMYSVPQEVTCHNCPRGTYNNQIFSDTCTPCPFGSYCPEKSTEPIQCMNGTISVNGGTEPCDSCPAGSYCIVSDLGIVQDMGPCPMGTHSAKGDVTCRACPRGYACPFPSTIPVLCQTGTYSATNETQCRECRKGHTCIDPAQEPVQCKLGSYCNTVNCTECRVCPKGYKCPDPSELPSPCPVGTFSDEMQVSCSACSIGTFSIAVAQSNCQICPAGYSCLLPSMSPLPCALGTFSEISDSVCHACPPGYICPQKTSSHSISCPTGTFSNGNATVCTICPPGTSCSNSASIEPILCDPGTYSIDTSLNCIPCPPGYSCLNPKLSPILCLDGSYAIGGAATCAQCPYKHKCPAVDRLPIACASGEIHTLNYRDCIICPKGYECSTSSPYPIACNKGTYSLEGFGTCSACPKGSFCPTTSLEPSLCSEIGSYSYENATECLPCPVGFYCSHPSIDPIPCPPNHFSHTTANTQCIPCPIGHSCLSASTAPVICTEGTYSAELASSCVPCPAGYSCISVSKVPVKCPFGTYSLTSTSSCLSCPNGFACLSSSSLPISCILGTFSTGNQTSCTPCPAGFACPFVDQNLQEICKRGTYSLLGSAYCTECPIGAYCPDVSKNLVIACDAGTFSIGSQEHCTACPIGYKCPQKDGSANVLCPYGSYGAIGGAVISCTQCPAGYACPRPTDVDLVPCEKGTYSVGGYVTSCTACPAGNECPDTNTRSVRPCALGKYSLGKQAACTSCPAGYACPSTDKDDFQRCTIGYYSPLGNPICLSCPKGYYCEYPEDLPKPCSAGFYSFDISSVCTACPAGYMCPQADLVPQPCPVGYYSGGGVISCSECRAGYKCSAMSTSPAPIENICPIGGYCNPSTTFTLCPAGTFGNVVAGESVDHACVTCLEGYACESGSTFDTMTPCSLGHYCPRGTMFTTQFPCPAGTFNIKSNGKSLSDCIDCPAGTYCEKGSVSPTPCPRGYYCLEKTIAMDATPCPSGTYSGPRIGLQDPSECITCISGAYCRPASVMPSLCPAGTYNSVVGAFSSLQCSKCPPGFSCPNTGQSQVSDLCAVGHFCPTGTASSSSFPCLAGTFTDYVNASQPSDCTICPQRHACPSGTGGQVQPMQSCSAGFFCPNGTAYANQYPCLPGTYSSSISLAASDECEICPKGYFCSGGKDYVDERCAAGHFCPKGTSSSNKYPCPSGTYSSVKGLYDLGQCEDCVKGHYCPEGSTEPIPCPSGSYSESTKTQRAGPESSGPVCIICPAGYHCPKASQSPIPCGIGQYSNTNADVCLKCKAGHFCASNVTSEESMKSDVLSWQLPSPSSGMCYNGTFCPAGMDHLPSLVQDPCPLGHYCPKGTIAPVPCPAGTYNGLSGQDQLEDCLESPAGMYSVPGSQEPTGECLAGYYCPKRSMSPTQIPCPAGYYLNRTKGQGAEDCSYCMAGFFCPLASSFPIVCPYGYYCGSTVYDPTPCPMGTYSNVNKRTNVNECIICSPGMFCDATALLLPRGPCKAGHYCLSGSHTSTPLSHTNIGGICPTGSYCPQGSVIPLYCPLGTFSNKTGLETVSDCNSCSPGMYCDAIGLVAPVSSCYEGYYCTIGARSPTEFVSPAGYFSKKGASAASPCPLKTYNLFEGQSNCSNCPSGYYCPLSATVQPIICLSGHYCPMMTDVPKKCLPGTFSNRTGLVSATECLPCPGGMYCSSYGLIEPSGKCYAGYVCIQSSVVPDPNGDTIEKYGRLCSAGHYCPQGSGMDIPCPQGTYRSALGGMSASESCLPCPGGMYCARTGLTEPMGLCKEGFYCTIGSYIYTIRESTERNGVLSIGGICPAGHFCPQGAIYPIRCKSGTFTSNLGEKACQICPFGFYCDGLETDKALDCPKGYYCPLGTGEKPVPCPIGTMSNRIRLSSVDECLSCKAGSYCDELGLSEPTGVCAPGFVCPAGSLSKFGNTNNTMQSIHLCPAGFFCPEGTYIPSPCPRGTYSNRTQLSFSHQCTFCEPGKYCVDVGLQSVSGVCDNGYFCKRNNTVANPNIGVHSLESIAVLCDNQTVTTSAIEFGGDMCPAGTYCPSDSVSPRTCPRGTYAKVRGQSECKQCPAGYSCAEGSIDYINQPCPRGYYCPEATEREYPCPPGTFGASENLESKEQCTFSPGGTYVDTFAAIKPTGYCMSGFFCSRGSDTKSPVRGSLTGGTCPPGTRCPVGSSSPITCPAGHYCVTNNTDFSLPCEPGYYCIQGSFTATPSGQNNSIGVIGDVCPAGHFCPEKSGQPKACPPGTYSRVVQQKDVSDCQQCIAGYLCSIPGLIQPYKKCPAGYYCTSGDREATQLCPKGFECPEGSSEPRECLPGFYGNETGMHSCRVCPSGKFCADFGNIQPQSCPLGFYCPSGTIQGTSHACLPGTYGSRQGLGVAVECNYCPAGSYCSGYNSTDKPTGPCAPGYYCNIGSSTASPSGMDDTGGLCAEGFVCLGNTSNPFANDGVTGHVCNPGHYCPRGSSYPIPCEKGTYNPYSQKSECLTCPSGYYCDKECINPVKCPVGSFCPQGIKNPIACPIGTYSLMDGLEDAVQCSPCVAGKYCLNGHIAASCEAGYHCKRWNYMPNPFNVSENIGEPCPIGFYCPEGTPWPISCPSGTARLITHGMNESSCGSCPAGMDCTEGSNTQPCPKGYYCPAASNHPFPCPLGRYNNLTSKVSFDSCNTCPEGTLCDRVAVSDPFLNLCPAGTFCLAGCESPMSCPEGTYRDQLQGVSIDDCKVCPGGSYCPQGASRSYVCNGTTYCPSNSGRPTNCPAGYYCNYNSTAPTACPPGYYCPPKTETPLLCETGYFCEGTNDVQTPCPLGYIGISNALESVHKSQSQSCVKCSPGTYSSEVNQTQCTTCEAGYVCLDGTTSQFPTKIEIENGYACPPGFICPNGTRAELPCPAGTYQPRYKASSISDCMPCPENSYQNSIGSTSCFPCSSSSFTRASGSTDCICKGSHRSFQISDGLCVCEPGFESFDEKLSLQSDRDGTVDCQPIVYNRCGRTETRADNGSCIALSDTSCGNVCPDGKGEYVRNVGICSCSKLIDVDMICDKKCRSQAKQILVNASSGLLQIYDPLHNTTSELEKNDASGKTNTLQLRNVVCNSSLVSPMRCQLHAVLVGASSFSGTYDLPPSITGVDNGVSPTQRRLSSASLLTIPNPMLCINFGGGVIFDLSDSTTSLPSYPVYLKDSLLNSNPGFDYGAFRALANKMSNNSASSIKSFAFTFVDPGIYVFGNSLNPEARTLVSVMRSDTACPMDTPIMPLNEENLLAVRAIRRDDEMILKPDWTLVIVFFIFTFVFIVFFVFVLYLLQTKLGDKRIADTLCRSKGYRAKNRENQSAVVAVCNSMDTVPASNIAYIEPKLDTTADDDCNLWMGSMLKADLKTESCTDLTSKNSSKNADKEKFAHSTEKLLSEHFEIQRLLAGLVITKSCHFSATDSDSATGWKCSIFITLEQIEMDVQDRTFFRQKQKDALSHLDRLLEDFTELHLTTQMYDQDPVDDMQSMAQDLAQRIISDVRKSIRSRIDLEDIIAPRDLFGEIEKVVIALKSQFETKIYSGLDAESVPQLIFVERIRSQFRRMIARTTITQAHALHRSDKAIEQSEDDLNLLCKLDAAHQAAFVGRRIFNDTLETPFISDNGNCMKDSVYELHRILENIISSCFCTASSSVETETMDYPNFDEYEQQIRENLSTILTEAASMRECILKMRAQLKKAETTELAQEREIVSMVNNLDRCCSCQKHNQHTRSDVSNTKAAQLSIAIESRDRINAALSCEKRSITGNQDVSAYPTTELGVRQIENEGARMKERMDSQPGRTRKDLPHTDFNKEEAEIEKQFQEELEALKIMFEDGDMLKPPMEEDYRIERAKEKKQPTLKSSQPRTDGQFDSFAKATAKSQSDIFRADNHAQAHADPNEIKVYNLSHNTAEKEIVESSTALAPWPQTRSASCINLEDNSTDGVDTISRRELDPSSDHNLIPKDDFIASIVQHNVRKLAHVMQDDLDADFEVQAKKMFAIASKNLENVIKETCNELENSVAFWKKHYSEEADEIARSVLRDGEQDKFVTGEAQETSDTLPALAAVTIGDIDSSFGALKKLEETQVTDIIAGFFAQAQDQKDKAHETEQVARDELCKLKKQHESALNKHAIDQIEEKAHGQDKLQSRLAARRIKLGDDKILQGQEAQQRSHEDVSDIVDDKVYLEAEKELLQRIQAAQESAIEAEAKCEAIEAIRHINSLDNQYSSSTKKAESISELVNVGLAMMGDKIPNENALKSVQEIEKLFDTCKLTHNEESEKLRSLLSLERQRQENALRERIRQRKDKNAFSNASLSINDDSSKDELQKELESLQIAIEAQEAAWWSSIRERQKQELQQISQKAQEVAAEKKKKVMELQEHTDMEMIKLRAELTEGSNKLQSSLLADSKRVERRLQDRIAERKRKSELSDRNTPRTLPSTLQESEIMDADTAENRLNKEKESRLHIAKKEAVEAMLAAQFAEKLAEEMKNEALRAKEIDRLATEFSEKQRELSRDHQTDMETQRRRLEARIHAKKEKQLLLLERKREMERALSEKLEIPQKNTISDFDRSKAANMQAIVTASSENQSNTSLTGEMEPARQLEHDITILRQLCSLGIIPEKLSLRFAVDLIVTPRHKFRAVQLFHEHAKTIALAEKRRNWKSDLETQDSIDIQSKFENQMLQMKERDQREIEFLIKYISDEHAMPNTHSSSFTDTVWQFDTDLKPLEFEALQRERVRIVNEIEAEAQKAVQEFVEKWSQSLLNYGNNAMESETTDKHASAYEAENRISIEQDVLHNCYVIGRKLFYVQQMFDQKEKALLFEADQSYSHHTTASTHGQDQRLALLSEKDICKRLRRIEELLIPRTCQTMDHCVELTKDIMEPVDISNLSKELQQCLAFLIKVFSTLNDGTITLTVTEFKSPKTVLYNQDHSIIFVSSSNLAHATIGREIVRLLIAFCQLKCDAKNAIEPKYLAFVYKTLARSYQSLYESESFFLDEPIKGADDARVIAKPKGKWKNYFQEIELFLASVNATENVSESGDKN